jgi:hypothetical protein
MVPAIFFFSAPRIFGCRSRPPPQPQQPVEEAYVRETHTVIPKTDAAWAPSAYALIAPDPLALAVRGRRRQKSGQWLFDCAYDGISTVGGAHNTSAQSDNIEVPA